MNVVLCDDVPEGRCSFCDKNVPRGKGFYDREYKKKLCVICYLEIVFSFKESKEMITRSKCKGCENRLDLYEEKANYCLPCFDEIRKRRINVRKELRKKVFESLSWSPAKTTDVFEHLELMKELNDLFKKLKEFDDG